MTLGSSAVAISPRPSKALLLAAGLGSRLRPITDSLPKCLVPIDGKPLLYHWIELLCLAGVDEVIVNTHYFAEQVSHACEQSPWQRKLVVDYEPQLLGTAGTLRRHLKRLAGHDFWLIHADNLSRFSVPNFIEVFENRPSNCLGTMMTFVTDSPTQCGIALCDENKVLRQYFEKVADPPSNCANAAVFLLDSEIFPVLASSPGAFDFCRDIVPKLIGRINTFANDCYHRDIGTVESYQQAIKDFRHFTQ